MAKQNKAKAQSDEKSRTKVKRTVVEERSDDLAGLAKLPGGPIAVVGGSTIQAQVAWLSEGRLQGAQRRALVAQIGRVQGNRHLQRVVASVKGETKTTPYPSHTSKPPTYQSHISKLPVTLQCRGLSDYDPAIRQRIQVVRTTVRPDQIPVPHLFSADTRLGASYPIEYAENVPSALQHGLGNVANHLRMNTTALPANSTLTVTLDLTAYPGGSNSVFRFTHVDVERSGVRTYELLVENVGTLPSPTTPTPQNMGTLEARFSQYGFQIGSMWSDDRRNILLQAVGQIPDSILASAPRDIQFNYSSAPLVVEGEEVDGEADGYYDQNNNIVWIYGRAFEPSLTRFGRGHARVVQAVAHEIGHAIDYRALGEAWQSAEATQSEAPLGGVHSRSGYSWQLVNNQWDVIEGTAMDNDFRRAAREDAQQIPQESRGERGARGITEYAHRDWREYFAEAFSIYITDPSTLASLRPHVYEYFVQNFPP